MSIEFKVHKWVNRERKKRHIRSAKWDKRLAKLARKQAKYCARKRRLIHSDRFAFQGGENLAMIGGKFNPRLPAKLWLKSKQGHREYLLSPRVTKAGVGIAQSRGNTYVAWAFSDEFIVRKPKLARPLGNIFRKIRRILKI